MRRLAQVITAAPAASARARRAAGVGAAGAMASALAAVGIQVTGGAAGMVAAGLAAAFAGVSAAGFLRAAAHRRQEARERRLLAQLALTLPPDWYLLRDLHVPGDGGEEVRVWVVIAPGGLVVAQLLDAGGELHPAGPVWVVGSGRSSRVVPSPALRCYRAAETLRRTLSQGRGKPLTVRPVVVLTDPSGIYYPAKLEALVVGAPHLCDTVLRCGSGEVLTARERFRIAVQLCQLFQ